MKSRKNYELGIGIKFSFNSQKVAGEITGRIDTETGNIRFYMEGTDVEVYPDYLFREAYLIRPDNLKKPKKTISVMPVSPYNANISGTIGALTSYDVIYVVDTNCQPIDGDTVHASAFLGFYCRQVGEQKIEIVPYDDAKLRVFEFRNPSPNIKPENLAWRYLIQGIPSAYGKQNQKSAILTDSDLGNIIAYNKKEKPIVNDFMLPDNFTILYASGDYQYEPVNQFMKFIDKRAKQFLSDLKSEKCTADMPLTLFEEGLYTGFRMWTFNGEWFPNNPIIGGVKLQTGSTVSLFGYN